VTGFVATVAGLASIVMPLVTGWMSKSGNISIIFIFDAFLSVTGFIAAVYVYYRYGKLMGKGKEQTGIFVYMPDTFWSSQKRLHLLIK
jgi:hypothetical protein